MEHRCPSCQSPLYSRRTRVCGQCGAALPREMFVTDEQVQTHEKEREWARKLADAFDAQSKSIRSGGFADVLDSETEQSDISNSPEELLRRLKRADKYYAEEFRHRKRPGFWLELIAHSFTLALFGFVATFIAGIPLYMWLPLFGLHFLLSWQAWLRASPICPNCQQNIRYCSPVHCHVCAKLLRQGRCSSCSVDYAWTGWFTPFTNGKLKSIAYCPGCGVRLDSWVRRWDCGD